MRGRTLIYLGLLSAIVAVVLIITRNSISSRGVVTTGGVLFILVSLANSVALWRGNGSSLSRTGGFIVNAAALALGVWMLLARGEFVKFVPLMFAVLIGLCMLWQIYVLAVGRRPHYLPSWLYVFPVLMAVAIACIFYVKGHDSLVVLLTGLSAAVMAIGCFFEGGMLGTQRRRSMRVVKHETSGPDLTKAATETAKEEPKAGIQAKAEPTAEKEPAATAAATAENDATSSDKTAQ